MGLNEKLEGEDENQQIEKQWLAAQLFMAKGPSATLEFLVDDAKAKLFALRAQAVDGPCRYGESGTLTVDHALRKKQEAWASLGNMPKDTAKRRFLEFLTDVLPQWKEWSDTEGEALRLAQSEGTAERILRQFRSTTGSVAIGWVLGAESLNVLTRISGNGRAVPNPFEKARLMAGNPLLEHRILV